MSFIDKYMKKHRIGDISKGARKNLDKLEKKLDNIVKKGKGGLSFLDAIKKYGDEAGDLIERVQKHFDGWKLSFGNVFSTFQFVISIATEVYQLVDSMHDDVVPDGLTGEKAWEAKKAFGQELVYFIWKTVGPIDKSFNWIPFKKTIEKRLVLWLAGMGLESARKFFTANEDVSSFSANDKAVFMKAL